MNNFNLYENGDLVLNCDKFEFLNEPKENTITFYYGDNEMNFKPNGEIVFNGKALGEDKEILNGLRKVLGIKMEDK